MRTLFFLFCVSLPVTASPTLLFEQDKTLLTTTVEVVVHTGAALDPKGKTGEANLLSQLMVRGTKLKNRSNFQSTIERLGGTLSGSASHDTIQFSGAVISENTAAFFDLMREFLTKPAFSAKEFRALKTETTGAIRHSKNSNTRLGGLALRKEAFKGTPLERPTRGSLSTVGKVRLSDLKKRYARDFHQNNFTFAVVSPLSKKQIESLIAQIWKPFKKGTRSKIPTFEPKFPKTPRLVVVHKPKTSTGSIFLAQRGIVANEPSRYNLKLANFSFGGGGMLSRLFTVVRGQLGWTYSIGATYGAMGSPSNQVGLYAVYSTPSIEFTAKTLMKVLSMWDTYLQAGTKSDELALARESSINAYPFNFDSPHKRLGWKLFTHLYGVAVPSPSEYAKRLQQVNSSSLKKALSDLHTPRGWIVSVVADANVLKRQLVEEQKGIPKKDRLSISRVIQPNSVIR